MWFLTQVLEKIRFQQDGAVKHKELKTMMILKDSFPGYVISAIKEVWNQIEIKLKSTFNNLIQISTRLVGLIANAKIMYILFYSFFFFFLIRDCEVPNDAFQARLIPVNTRIWSQIEIKLNSVLIEFKYQTQISV